MPELTTSTKTPHIGILGGGITGLTAGFYLLRAGYRVTILESREQVGGLATYYNFGPFWWDKFYHVILTSDAPLLQLVEDLGLTPQLKWTETKVGFFTDKGFCSMTTSMDFLKFPVLNLWEKFRLGLGVLRANRIKDGKKLEAIPIADWLVRIFGRGNYEKMWEPLLKCKLGSCREEASAAFIWATITRLYSTREKGVSQKEKMGYVTGGYRTVFTRMIGEIEKLGGKILVSTPVDQVGEHTDGQVCVKTPSGNLVFDRVIATAPSHIIEKMIPELSEGYRERLRGIKYLGMVCVVLLLRRKMTPYYVTNLTEDVPFTGVIEMTNLIATEETNGRHLIYLPKYTAPGDPLFEASDDEVWELFGKSFRRMFPDLKEGDIEKRLVFREKLVQPLPTLNYSDRVPPIQTNLAGVMVANTTQIINSTLNNNEMVKIARRAVDLIHKKDDTKDFAPRPDVWAGS